MKPLLIVLLALVGCASEPERLPRKYCVETGSGRIVVINGQARLACDNWCKTRGGCLCRWDCLCKGR